MYGFYWPIPDVVYLLKFGYFLLADQKKDLVVQLVNGKYDLSRYGD